MKDSTQGQREVVTGVVYGDSIAATAIYNMRGCGKLRHIAIGLLWIQENMYNDENCRCGKCKAA